MTVPNSGGQAYSANGHDVASEMLWAARGPGHPGSHQEERDQAVRGERAAQGPSALRLVWIFPDLLSTYGDRGNLIMLARRARLPGLAVGPSQVNSDQPGPREGDIYLLGGGEDLPQVLAAQRLRAGGGLAAAAANGAVIFAVCAGYQLIGTVFGGAQGEPVEGLGIVNISSGRGERRGVGEVLADVRPQRWVAQTTRLVKHPEATKTGPGGKTLYAVLLTS